MKIKLDMIESDIVRAIKNTKYSPIDFLASRFFKEDINNIDVRQDSITLWNDNINDYISYKYCIDDIDLVIQFIEEWSYFKDGHIDEFSVDPITFCVEEKN
jgi:hypothetical protein